MKKTTITIDGHKVTADLGTIRALLGLSEMATDNAMGQKKAPKAPKKAEEPKAEDSPKEPVYTKGGLLLQWGDEIAAKGQEKAVITKAYNALVKQGFTVTRKRVGSWVYLYQTQGETKRPCKEFGAAKLGKGWIQYKGMWAYPDLLKGYEDNTR